eukprot:CAMPEP_0174262126 /NCGR_PEP_ID=MMETSP0439-20130205/12787_1 /TAXON_ID=0 /ORGANISM="Stereomyxa ramosa, Strain Chinc5" /LENGTH=181 /DNA_ID=CAMNT_0015346773 /DNA_START=119 /DNA_END=661 /DNA_ORIENTATION=-
MDNFNVSEYISAPWYAQQQMAVIYLPEDENYCVYTRYTRIDATNLQVHNYANEGKVNGKVHSTDSLKATILDPKIPSQLAVGPDFLPPSLYGPYWVIAAGPESDNYHWALVSGGPPTHESNGACKTGTGVNGSGLWIFSRDQTANSTEVEMVRQLAEKKGFDLSVLHPVVQKGCLYQAPEE